MRRFPYTWRMGAGKRNRLSFSILLSAAALVAVAHDAWAGSTFSATGQSATVAMEVRDNRVFIPLTVVGANGKSKVVLFWVDSGGDMVAFGGPLARDLGLEASGASFVGMGETPSHPVTKPRLSIAGMDIDLAHVSVSAAENQKSRDVFAGIEAEGFLPATVLKNYDVIFDYPGRTFTMARSGTIVHRGRAVAMSVQPASGFARVELGIAGQTYGFMLDTGAAYTGVSRALMDRLIGEHPSWPHSLGAVGAANMVGKPFDVGNELLRVPEIAWGPLALRDTGMVSRPTGVYEKAVSEDMSAPVVGALAGNVLRHFRLDLDYPAGLAYLEMDAAASASDLDCVGLILRVKEDGSVIVSGVAQRGGRAEVAGVEAGDVLLRVDGHEVTGASLATILDLLSGTVGVKKLLKIRRRQQQMSMVATVFRHP